MFDLIKKTFCIHHGRCRKTSLLAKEEIANIEAKKAMLKTITRPKSSQKLQLPPIPSLKPLTLNDLASELNETSWIEKSQEYTLLTFSFQSRLIELTGPNYEVQKPIRRKPVPNHEFQSSDFYLNESVNFDPNAPLINPSIHARARKVLKERYQSKFTFGRDSTKDLTQRVYDVVWVDEEELDRKVLYDIIWVRQRYAQAKRKEPNDQDILWWYDAKDYYNGISNEKL